MADPLTTTQVRDTVVELEGRFPVDSWTVGSVHVWPLIRLDLYFSLFYAGRTVPMAGSASRLRRRLATARRWSRSLLKSVVAVARDRKHNASVSPGCGCVFLTYAVHRIKVGDAWYDKFCDPFVDGLSSLGVNSLLLELSPNDSYFLPRHGHSKLVQSQLIAAEIVSWHAHADGPPVALDRFADMLAELDRSFPGASLPSLAGLRRKCRLIFRLRDYFSRVLAKAKPTVVFIAEYYSVHGAAMILAAREKGIQTVDIQHGIQGDEHLAYGSWTKFPRGGYEVLPSVFWCWSNYEADCIKKWNGPFRDRHDTFVGGNLWARLWNDPPSDFAGDYDETVSRLKSRVEKPVHVLFTPSMTDDVKDWILQTVGQSARECFWWIRVHPCHLQERGVIRGLLARHGLTNFNIEEATDLPLEALLRHMDVNVTPFSSTVVDAEYAGIPSVLVDPAGVGLFPQQIASGSASCAFDPDALLAAIRRHAGKMRAPSVRTARTCEETLLAFLDRHAPHLVGTSPHSS